MSITFRPAVREQVGLIIGLAGSSGSGKTYSAMRLASGIAGDKRFAVIDTEAGRAKHYADQFNFDHADLRSPFRPESYSEAIAEADKAAYPVIVVDSMSHVWAGDGGCLDWQEEEFSKKGYAENFRMASWIKPKLAHKRMVSKLLQVRSHLILCFRAEPKVEMVKGKDGKMQVQEKRSPIAVNGWLPVCEKMLPYELTVSFLLMADRPGCPIPIKLQEQHKAMFPADRLIDETSGRSVLAWAAGGTPRETITDAGDGRCSRTKATRITEKWKALTKQHPDAASKIRTEYSDRIKAVGDFAKLTDREATELEQKIDESCPKVA